MLICFRLVLCVLPVCDHMLEIVEHDILQTACRNFTVMVQLWTRTN